MNTRTDHYYTAQPESKSQPTAITYTVNGVTLQITADRGVFSKKQVDFGTDLLIRTLPPLAGRVLDLGCGYGVVGIALARLNPAAEVVLCDINERAAALSRENLRRNLQFVGKDGSVDFPAAKYQVVQSDGFARIEGSFQAIALNPPIRAGKATVYRLYHDAFKHLYENGSLYIVIQKKQGMESSQAELTRIFGNCECLARKSGYHILRSIRMADCG